MKKSRMEAFSDGVLAVIITIMVLEIKAPQGDDLQAFKAVLPGLLSYVLSFVYVGIYWNNHHHMLHIVEKVNGDILWRNMILLFFLSLIPFTTKWMDETSFKPIPVVIYGINLLICALAYVFMQTGLINIDGEKSKLAEAIKGDFKGKISPVLYILGIVSGYFFPLIGLGFYTIVAIIWINPDKRIERFYDGVVNEREMD